MYLHMSQRRTFDVLFCHFAFYSLEMGFLPEPVARLVPAVLLSSHPLPQHVGYKLQVHIADGSRLMWVLSGEPARPACPTSLA